MRFCCRCYYHSHGDFSLFYLHGAAGERWVELMLCFAFLCLLARSLAYLLDFAPSKCIWFVCDVDRYVHQMEVGPWLGVSRCSAVTQRRCRGRRHPHPQRYDSVYANMAKIHASTYESRCDATGSLCLVSSKQASKKVSKSTTPSSATVTTTTAPAPAVSATNPPRHESIQVGSVATYARRPNPTPVCLFSPVRAVRVTLVGHLPTHTTYVRRPSVLRTVRPNKGEVRDTRQPVGVGRWCRGAEQACRRVWDARARADSSAAIYFIRRLVGCSLARS
ncbi:hypothetical protein IWX90DRAFT_271677 [Phyllosticta citrichinensis]|uniref:Uncharacterized protein n=1 Tax=Phyllosticta citrichinensis TaxID=1130410 RepID=A0ABR1XMT5_9PEZI